jgi:hypothetical protein
MYLSYIFYRIKKKAEYKVSLSGALVKKHLTMIKMIMKRLLKLDVSYTQNIIERKRWPTIGHPRTFM